MKNYIFVKDEDCEKTHICRFGVENKEENVFKYMLEDIQNKGPIVEERLCFNVAHAMEENNIPSRIYIDDLFHLKYGERIEYISAQRSGTDLAPVHGPNYEMEEDDYYNVKYYRYMIHPLITIHDDLKEHELSFITYRLKVLLKYALEGTYNEKYYANQMLSTIQLKERDLDSHIYQLISRLSILIKYGTRYNSLLNQSAISAEDFGKAKQKTKK